MATIVTAGVTGGTITIGLGGIGSDNLKGDLTDTSGSLVSGVDITFVRLDGSTQDTDTTNGSGEYDVDVNGKVGDSFRVTATWVDVAGRNCRVSGTFTITQADVLMAGDPKGDDREDKGYKKRS